MTQPNPDPFRDIPTTRRWWSAHRPRVAAAMPLRVGPATYTARFPECMDRWLTMADDLPPVIANAYIRRPLTVIRKALTDAP